MHKNWNYKKVWKDNLKIIKMDTNRYIKIEYKQIHEEIPQGHQNRHKSFNKNWNLNKFYEKKTLYKFTKN